MRALERIRFLVVDDNQHMIQIVRTILRGFGAKDILEARDPAEAFDLVRSDSIDIVIVDYNMAILDGAEFVRLVRTAKDSRNPFVPIIMLTAYSERSRVESARDAGVTEFCVKPVTAADLYRKIVATIEAPRPFVKTSQFFGPDRRRRAIERQGPDRRSGP